MSSGGGAEDIEIVVNKRKALDESQALKLLSTFLDKDQKKKPEDQVCTYANKCASLPCRHPISRLCVVALSPLIIHPDLPGSFISPHTNLSLRTITSFSHPQIPSDVLHQLQTVRDNLQGGASHHGGFDEEEEEEDESSKDHHQQPPPAQQQQQQERIEASHSGSKEKEKKDKKKKKHKKDK